MSEIQTELREIRRWLVWQTALLAALLAVNGIPILPGP